MTEDIERWKRKNDDQIILVRPRNQSDPGHELVLVMRETRTTSYSAGTQFWISWDGLSRKFTRLETQGLDTEVEAGAAKKESANACD